jgi:inhibitor of the pro-sigma K processing machinery
MMLEIFVFLIAIAAAYIIYRIMKKLAVLLVNSIIALIMLFALNLLGLKVAITVWSVLIVVIGGIIGLVFVVLLHLLGIAF